MMFTPELDHNVYAPNSEGSSLGMVMLNSCKAASEGRLFCITRV